MRNLASIQIIDDLIPIVGKDRIELALVKGWQVIVQKGEYQKGDKTIFVEIDSVLPEKPEFEFLRPKKFRIKTLKMAGVLSQGICFQLSILPKGNYGVGDDVTEVLGIKKYEPYSEEETPPPSPKENKKLNNPILRFLFRFKFIRNLFLTKKENRGFPSFIEKTDETRIQNIPVILKNKEIKYVAREKIDGQSGTFFLKRVRHPRWMFWKKDSFDFGVCSRNLRLWKEDSSSFWFVAKKYKIKEVLESLIGSNEDFIAIQGECIAPNVQGNKYKVSEPDLYVFNFISEKGKVDCQWAETILKDFGLKWCPLVAVDFTLPDSVNEILDFATGKSALYNTLREGLVFRNYQCNVSFKAVSPEFLIKNDE